MHKKNIPHQPFDSRGLGFGRMIYPSKSAYRRLYPDHEVVFNATIFHCSKGNIWWGDLDLTLDDSKLQEIAGEIGEFLVLREADGRFLDDQTSYEELKTKAVKFYV